MTTTKHILSNGNFSQDWNQAGVVTANDDWSVAASIVGYRGDNLTSATDTDPQTLTAHDSAPVIDVIANQANPNTNNSGGVAEFELADPTIALQGSGTADAPYIAIYLDSTGRENVTFSFNARDIDGSGDNAVQQIAVQYRTSATGTWTNVPTGYIADASSGPSLANQVTPVSVTLPSDANNAETLEIRVITTNAAGNDEWIGIDNILVTSSAIAAPNPGTLSINDVSMNEGDSGTTEFEFTVTRSGGSAGVVSAYYEFSPTSGNTVSQSDFGAGMAFNGTVNFADGATTATITVLIQGDTVVEPDEGFAINLSAPTGGATITDSTGIGTVLNDDAPPSPGTLSINDVSMNEGNSGSTNFTFTVTRSGGSAGVVSASFGTVGITADSADFFSGPFNGSVQFADGETSKTVTFSIAGDTVVEANEAFEVLLFSPTGGVTITDDRGTGTILNDDLPPIANVFINEIHYDNSSTDVGEGAEIAGLAGTDLTGWSLVFYNGNGGGISSGGGTLALSGVIDDEDDGYGALGFLRANIENGAPDGVALVDNFGRVVQFLSWEGSFTATAGAANGLTSIDIGVDEDPAPAPGTSLQLTGDGGVYGDFTWVENVDDSFGDLNTGQNFLSPDEPGFVSIADLSQNEGNFGETEFTFTVTRAGGSNLTGSVSYTAAEGTAAATDFPIQELFSGTVEFAVGETSKTITVLVNGDTFGEPNETFSVTLSNPVGLTIVDGEAIGTIVNDDPIALAIYDIQGETHSSEYAGQVVLTTGIVTAVDSDGFYIQDANGDGNAATSDAIFVAIASPRVVIGQEVEITGTVAEFLPGNNSDNLTTTRVTASSISILSSDNSVPGAVLIGAGPGGVLPPSVVFDDDGFASFDPGTDAADFYESLEGMRVTIDAPLVVAPTNGFGETLVVASGGEGATGLNSNNGMTISGSETGPDDYNPERIQLDDDSGLFAGFTPGYSQGDVLSSVTGIVSYNFTSYEVLVTEAVTVTDDAPAIERETTTLVEDETHVTMANFNVENLDPTDDPARFEILAADIVYNLAAPDIIALQEIQDADGAGSGTDYSGAVTAQLLIDEIFELTGKTYAYVEIAPTANNQTGGEPNGNIRNGFLYDTGRVDYVANSAELVPGSIFNGTRSPLAATFVFNEVEITAISVHSTSRGGSDPLFGSIQPPANAGDAARIAQSQAIYDYVTDILTADMDANLAVLGDFNGFYFEESLELFEEDGLFTNLLRTLDPEERYSYVFDGNYQALDNFLVTQGLFANAVFDVVHINSEQPDTPARGSDHDPSVASFFIPVPNVAPEAVDDDVSVNEDALTGNLVATLLANDTDADEDDTLTVSAVDTTDTLGTVVFDEGTQTLTYLADDDLFDTLAPGETYEDTFEYTVSDEDGETSTATVTVTVTGIADGITVNGTIGANTLSGTNDEDNINGLEGNDVLNGLGGNDRMNGGEGRDTIDGGDGRDLLLGGLHNDILRGGNGDDVLSGGAGQDLLEGGLGADTFVINRGGARDTIADFDVDNDILRLENGLTVERMRVQDTDNDGQLDLVLGFAFGGSVVILGVADINLVDIELIGQAKSNDFML